MNATRTRSSAPHSSAPRCSAPRCSAATSLLAAALCAAAAVPAASAQQSAPAASASPPIWSAASAAANPAAAPLPDGLHGADRPSAEIAFNIARPPAFGAEFSFMLTDATQTGPQAAVFLNGMLQGVIQLWGTAPTQLPYKWRKIYRLYLPPNAFAAGANTLAVRIIPPIWSPATPEVMGRFWFKWEDARIDALAAAPRDAVHGKPFWLGTTLKQSTGFHINEHSLAIVDAALPWIGSAYSGNTMRADFWHDVAHMQPARRAYLEKLRDYNSSVLADNVSGHFHIDAAGDLEPAGKAAIDKFFADYGKLIQYYELGNEPSMFGGAYADYLATARHIHANRPAHLLLAATGWAYGGGKGEPVNWESDPARRRAIESWCDMINGHSYGWSYNDARGGSFFETFKTHGQPADGWPKPFIVSETGANDWHSENNGPRYPSRAPHVSAFDRILRAHVAVADRVMQHSLIFDDFGLFDRPGDLNDIRGTLRVRPGVNGEPPRLGAYRRIALAYATHGAPLETRILNPDELRGRLALIRAVDTLALAPLAGSLAKSDKILVNFVNFEDAPLRVAARVKMPQAGKYSALRIGDGADYAASHKTLAFTAAPAAPWLAFDETLAPGEAVQYILTTPTPRARPAVWNVAESPLRHTRVPPETAKLAAPSGLRAFGLGNRVIIDYLDTEGAELYQIERSKNGAAFAPVGGWTGSLAITDATAQPGNAAAPARYAYRVRAKNETQTSPYSETVTLALEKGAAPAGWTDTSIGSNASAGAALANADATLIQITAAGHDIWADKDGLRFLHKTIAADATLVARVLHYDRTHEHMKVGLMARAALDENSPMALIAQSPGSTVFNWRVEPSGATDQRGFVRQQWLKLERRGDLLTGYASPDGTLWTKVGDAKLPAVAAGNALHIGLALCSHSHQTSAALFDNVTLAESGE